MWLERWTGGVDRLGRCGVGRPTLDSAAVPLGALSAVLQGYGATEWLGRHANARIVWDHLYQSIEDAIEDPTCLVPVASYRRFLARAQR